MRAGARAGYVSSTSPRRRRAAGSPLFPSLRCYRAHVLLEVDVVDEIVPWLHQVGHVFNVFDRQDSGCVSYGIASGDARWFVKTAITASGVASLRRAIAFH